MHYTKDQIELFDKIFNYYFEYHFRNSPKDQPNRAFIAKWINDDFDMARDAINFVCEFGQQSNLLQAYQSGYGDWEILEMFKMNSKNFIEQGGFKNYFEKNKITDKPITINNFLSQSQSQNQSVEINMIFEAIKSELNSKQINELKKIFQEEFDKDKARQNVVEKIIGFGSNVAASILANILTNVFSK